MWILFVVSMVHGGQVVTMQEFTSKETCERARMLILSDDMNANPHGYTKRKALCVPK